MDNMHSINAEELKQIQINILNNVADFCEKENIHYWIDCGTLLGAVRHKGYIPWDDDIDIGMLKVDYDNFKESFNRLSDGRYLFKSIETDIDYPFAFGKVLDTKTIMYEPDEHGIKHSVNIDIFPYDNAPEKMVSLNLMYFKRDLYKTLRLLQMGILKPNGSILKQMTIRILTKLLKIFPYQHFTKKIIRNAQKYDNAECSHVGDFTSTSYIKCSKSIFNDFIKLEFEGNYYDVPIGYKEWLTAMYGDYMKLPPERERISNHFYIAYAVNDIN